MNQEEASKEASRQRNRTFKMQKLIRDQQEQQKKISRLNILEEDEDFQRDDNEDSDYEGEGEEEGEKKRKTKKTSKLSAAKMRQFGKINLYKYILVENENVNYDFPSFVNIVAKKQRPSKVGLCNICFGLAKYRCPNCSDKYCSTDCFKRHSEMKCTKYMEL